MSTLSSPTERELPAPKVGRRPKRHLAWVWLIPLLAVGIGLSILWREWSTKGPMITISFQSASGLEEGKTLLKFRDVVVGLVTDIRLGPDRKAVLVDVRLDKDVQGLANEGSQFWVVKPSIGLGGVTGLSTLFSGSYIEVDTTETTLTKARKLNFVGLEGPPPISSDRPGTAFRLRAPTLGSLQLGSPIYFLRIPVGVVSDYELDPAGHFVDIEVFVDAPYDKYVNGSTRFWNESGVYVNVGFNGLTIETESLISILAGGLAFASFGEPTPLVVDHVFGLFDNRAAADLVPSGVAVPIVMQFNQSTRGLEKGAPVTFHGVYLGAVESVVLSVDPLTRRFFSTVSATIYPARLGQVYHDIPFEHRNIEQIAPVLVSAMHRGMRAQLKSGSLLTGSLFVDIVYAPDTPIDINLSPKLPLAFPTVPSKSLDDLQAQLGEIVDNISKIQFQQIGQDLQSALTEVTTLANTLNATLSPELGATLKKIQTSLDGVDHILKSSQPIPGHVDRSLRELDRTIRAARQLIDEIREKPNALIFGEQTQPYSRDTLGAPN
jgi:paraquat-inducible protein B